MKVLKFLYWWWRGIEPLWKILFMIFGSFVTIILSGFFFGQSGTLTSLILVVLGVLVRVMYRTIQYFIGKWKKYQAYLDHEERQVINKLKGENTRPNPYRI